MASRTISVRLSVEDAEKVKQALEQFGASGEAALRRIQGATEPASRGLTAVNAVAQEARGHIDAYASRAGSLGTVLGALGPIGVAAAAGLAAVTAGLSRGLSEWSEMQQATARVQAVLRATGNQAGVTSGQIAQIASAIASSSTQTEQSVLRAAATLATFGSASRAGFGQVLELAADLSAVFGGDLQSNTETVARALQTLSTGSADGLGRSFANLSAEARQSIERLAETGRTAEAQQRFLEEMRRTVGGARSGEQDTLAGAFQQAASATGDMLRQWAEITRIGPALQAALRGIAAAARGAADAMSPEGQRSSGLTVTQSEIAGVQAAIDRRRRSLGLDDPDLSASSRARRERALVGDQAYQQAVQQLSRLRAAEQSQVDDAFASANSDARIANLAGAAGSAAAASEAAAATARRTDALREYNREQARALELARMAPELRARELAADQAEAEVKRRLVGATREELAAAVAAARAQASRVVALQQASQAGSQLSEQQRRATESIEQQISGLHEEQTALEQSERERAIAEQTIRAENTARQANLSLTEDQIARIRAEAGALYDTRQAREAYKRQLEETARSINRNVDRVVDFASDSFNKILEGGVGTWRKLGDEFLSIMRRAFAQAAAEAFVRPIVMPIVASLTQSFGGMFGAGSQAVVIQTAEGPKISYGGGTAGGGSSSGLGMLQNFPLGSLFSGSGGGSFLSGASTWLNNSIGVPLGFAPAGSLAPGTYGPLAAGQVYGTTLTSALGYGLPIVGATLPGLISGNYAQAGFGFGGAALGAVVGGPVGAAIGGFLGNLVGGLFGKRPSAPATSFAGIGVDLGLGGSLTETWRNGGSESNRRVPDYGPAGQMRLVVQDALKQIQSAVGARITGGRYAQGSLNYYTVGDTQSYVSYVNDGRGGSAALPTAEAAVRDFLSRVVPGLTFDGDARRAQLTTIANHGADKLEDLLTRLGQAKQFQDAYDALTDTQDALSATAQQLKALADQVDTLRDSAEEFGYTVAEIDAGYQQRLAKVRSDFDAAVQDQILGLTDPQAAALKAWEKERDQAVKDAGLVGGNIVEVERLYALKREAVIKASLGNIDTALRSWLDGQVFGAASSSSPATRLGEAQRMFGEQIAAARGGDATAIGGITGYANQLLASARDFYASSPEFAAIEAMTRSSIAGLGRALGLPGFATGGDFTVRGAGGTDSQVVAFRATPGERVSIRTPGQVASGGGGDQVVAALRQEMTAMRRDFRMLTHLLAMGRSA